MTTHPNPTSLSDATHQPPRRPLATYRLQFEPGFTLDAAAEIIDYLHDLGISDVYASPLTRPRPGSRHGYDVCDYNQINPELGGEERFNHFCRSLHAHGMGLLLDFVPNHMGIHHPSNQWWTDVLRHGPASRFASCFDIDWNPPDPELHNKVVLPILGEPLEQALPTGTVRLVFENDTFLCAYHQARLPICPATMESLLSTVLDQLDPSEDPDPETRQQLLAHARNGDPEPLTEALKRWRIAHPSFPKAIDRALSGINAPGSTTLHSILNKQFYHLAFWKTGNQQLNYRRFFDISDLAGVRVEDPAVFVQVHHALLRWMAEGKVTGLRIDHPDGLWDPAGYLKDLQAAWLVSTQHPLPPDSTSFAQAIVSARAELSTHPPVASGTIAPFYVLVEKILAQGERLPSDWPVDGTTGYEFLNDLNDLFIDHSNLDAMDRVYQRFSKQENSFNAEKLDGKRSALVQSLATESRAVGRILTQLAANHPRGQMFSPEELREALGDIIAALPVYRTYLTEHSGCHSAPDHQHLTAAAAAAIQTRPGFKACIQFVSDLLTLDDSTSPANRQDLIHFVLKCQQLSGPAMAKGVEDTAFYRFNRLLSANEVGGHPDRFGISVEAFHRLNQTRLRQAPHSLLATSTHDTKRSEDTRARINVLSEMPDEWQAALAEWSRMNEDKRTRVNDRLAPTPNDEYFLYQTLIGAWPLNPEPDPAQFASRIRACLQKSLREAKRETSWLNPNSAYESAVDRFIDAVLDPSASSAFQQSFLQFQSRIAWFGHLNSLAQTLLKLTSPGIPDFYQGSESWDLSLVDPDNRRAVDYPARRSLLAQAKATLTPSGEIDPGRLHDLVTQWQSGAIKTFLTWRALQFRQNHRDLFSTGDYVPVTVKGTHDTHICAFNRNWGGEILLVAVPRLVSAIYPDGHTPDPNRWDETHLRIDTTHPRRWRNVFTGEKFTSTSPALPAGQLFAHFPVALLHSEEA